MLRPAFLGPWADAQLYKRSGLTRYHEDLTPMLEARGPTANGLQLTRDATTGYFTEIADTASNAGFVPITNVLEDFSLTLDETKNIDLVFNYSENEIAALQSHSACGLRTRWGASTPWLPPGRPRSTTR